MNKRALERSSLYIKDWLRFNHERGDIPGLAVAIAHNGKIILSEVYGYANLERKEKLTPQHLFRIASHSKTFTATAILQLQEQGMLRIDDPVVDYLTWLKAHKDRRWLNVTIRQLLSHGAGVTRDGPNNDFWQVEAPFPEESQFKKDILSGNLIIDNNTALKYSNYGYTLLGLLIAEISGKPYNQYVTEKIVKPLGLRNTGPELRAIASNKFVTGYSMLGPRKRRLPVAQINTHVMSSATGFYSNAEDLCKYFTAQMVDSKKLLSDESKKEMQRTQWQAQNTRDREEYGLGLEIEYVNEHRLLGHGGGFPGHITKSYFDSKDKLAVIVLTNANGSWATYMGKSIVKVLDYFQNINQNPELQKYEGRYMNLWWNVDVIANGNRLILATADSWEPFESPDELEHSTENVFKITKTDSFSSVDETVEFQMTADGKVKKMIYAGGTLTPESTFIKEMAHKARIG